MWWSVCDLFLTKREPEPCEQRTHSTLFSLAGVGSPKCTDCLFGVAIETHDSVFVPLCVCVLVCWGCFSASHVMTSSRHRLRHIQSVCFLGWCNRYCSPQTHTSSQCLTTDRSWDPFAQRQLHSETCTMPYFLRIRFRMIHKSGISFIWMDLCYRCLYWNGEKKVHELTVNPRTFLPLMLSFSVSWSYWIPYHPGWNIWRC